MLNPHQAGEAYDSGADAYSYFNACDDRAAVHGMLVIVGSAATGLLIGTALRPLWRRRRDSSPVMSEPDEVARDR